MEKRTVIAKLLSWLLCRFWLWPAIVRYDAPQRPPARIVRRRWASVAQIGRRLVGVEIRLVYAPIG